MPYPAARDMVEINDTGFRYCRIAASSEASRDIQHTWTMYARRCRTAVEGVLPDSSAELYFNLGPTGRHLVGRDASRPSTSHRAAWIIGPHDDVLLLAKEIADCNVVGVRLQPGVIRRALGVPAGELRNQTVDLDAFWGGSVEELRDQLHHTPDPPGRAALLERALARRIAASDAGSGARRLERALMQMSGQGIGVIARELGLTHRRLISMCEEHIGLKPKEYRRVQRLRFVLDRISAGTEPHWARLACEAGFYDQAHLANDFRLLTGLTLSQYARTRSAVGVGCFRYAAAEQHA